MITHECAILTWYLAFNVEIENLNMNYYLLFTFIFYAEKTGKWISQSDDSLKLLNL